MYNFELAVQCHWWDIAVFVQACMPSCTSRLRACSHFLGLVYAQVLVSKCTCWHSCQLAIVQTVFTTHLAGEILTRELMGQRSFAILHHEQGLPHFMQKVCLPGGIMISFWSPCKAITVAAIMETTHWRQVIILVDCFDLNSINFI